MIVLIAIQVEGGEGSGQASQGGCAKSLGSHHAKVFSGAPTKRHPTKRHLAQNVTSTKRHPTKGHPTKRHPTKRHLAQNVTSHKTSPGT